MNKSLFGLVRSFYEFRQLISAFNPDVVHSHMVHANIFSRLLRLTTRIPRLICTAHNSFEGGRLRMLAYRLTDSLADLSTNVSEEAVQAFINKGAVKPGRMVAVYNGIDTRYFCFSQQARDDQRLALGISDGGLLLLAVGRLTEAKDYPSMLRAFAKIVSVLPTAKLAIAGTGALQTDLEAFAESYGIAGNVSFLGLRHDIAELMCAADLLVLSSAWEGFGLVVAEAMACERVVVATDCGGVREVVGDAGWLVPAGCSDALAAALLEALSLEEADKAALGLAARARVVSHFSVETAASRWLELYQG